MEHCGIIEHIRNFMCDRSQYPQDPYLHAICDMTVEHGATNPADGMSKITLQYAFAGDDSVNYEDDPDLDNWPIVVSEEYVCSNLGAHNLLLTLHNAGFNFITAVAISCDVKYLSDNKLAYLGYTCELTIGGN